MMRKGKTTWESLDSEIGHYSTGATHIRPPGFSLELGWIRPRQWWRPYITIQVWTWLFSVGWLL